MLNLNSVFLRNIYINLTTRITMAKDKEYIDVEQLDMIEEVHTRLDVLLDLLEEKGVLTKAQYESRLEKFYDASEEQ